MDEEQKMTLSRIQQLVEENNHLAQETNRLVHDLRRNARLAFWTRVVIWAFVIILPILLLKPIVNTLVPATAGSGGVFGLPSPDQLQEVLDTYQGQ